MPDTIVRVLACMECKTVEELSDFEGPFQHDEELAVAVSRHRYPSGDPHKGQLFRIQEQHWHLRGARQEIVQKIREQLEGGDGVETGLGSATYAMVDNFKDDAMKCFAAHHRNPACNDYKSEEKRLVPDTAQERRELGLAPVGTYDSEDRSMTRYLCEYCPVHSLVQQHARKKAGMYDK